MIAYDIRKTSGMYSLYLIEEGKVDREIACSTSPEAIGAARRLLCGIAERTCGRCGHRKRKVNGVAPKDCLGCTRELSMGARIQPQDCDICGRPQNMLTTSSETFDCLTDHTAGL